MIPANALDEMALASANTIDDELVLPHAFADLWRAVLRTAIEDALNGPPYAASELHRRRETEAARDYILKPNPEFAEVCHLAGCDPDAVRDRVARLIAEAPTPEVIASTSRRPKQNKRTGGGSRLGSAIGTGAGSHARESAELRFSNMDAEAR